MIVIPTILIFCHFLFCNYIFLPLRHFFQLLYLCIYLHVQNDKKSIVLFLKSLVLWNSTSKSHVPGAMCNFSIPSQSRTYSYRLRQNQYRINEFIALARKVNLFNLKAALKFRKQHAFGDTCRSQGVKNKKRLGQRGTENGQPFIRFQFKYPFHIITHW